jgi:hypothetical protein
VTISQAMTWFSATAGSIFLPFVLVEKFSSKEDLENYYLLITVDRFKFNAQWYLLLIKFVDLFFGFHKIYGKLIVPSVFRVAAYTICINTIITLSLQLPFILLIVPGNFLFDYLNFLKTRRVLEFVAKHRTVDYILLGMVIEIFLLILLYPVSFLTNSMIVGFFWSFWDQGYVTILLTALINTITASLSTIIVILFVVATVVSYFANNISVIQQFLDRHTAVLDKPIQTLGAMVVVLFALLFWTWFGLYHLVGPH